jgi:hypothetical protein
VYHIDVAKVDRDIAYVAMAIHVCCKRLFQMFHLFFSNVCCKYFYLNVAYISHITTPDLTFSVGSKSPSLQDF